jgi:hypothetical protein
VTRGDVLPVPGTRSGKWSSRAGRAARASFDGHNEDGRGAAQVIPCPTDGTRKAVIIPKDEVPFTEEQRSPLSDKDRDFLLSLLSAPPKANANLKKAAREHRQRHG